MYKCRITQIINNIERSAFRNMALYEMRRTLINC